MFFLGRSRGNSKRGNKNSLPQTPAQLKFDGVDEEFSRELANQADMEAQARANAANQRTRVKKNR
ncbi:YfhD family protein [Bacillus sp. KH172YL63]|uniref:YfhD family protein n=1 Tax=Bacillus sp. KH172YL63 TaxID=2709784 RepID=UPI003FA42FE3